MLTERHIKILNCIIKSYEPVSIKYLAELFNLSGRSIRYDIDNINYVLDDHTLPNIVRNSGGILSLEQKDDIKEYIESLTAFQYSLEVRSKLLLYQIALTGEVNIAAFSRELDLSRSSIKADIEKLKPTLASHKLVLRVNHKRGLILEGSEINIRTLQLSILLDFLVISEIENLVVNDVIQLYLGSIDSSIIDDYIFEVEKDTNNMITDEAYQVLKFYILISIKRIQSGQPSNGHNYREMLYSTDEFRSISKHKYLLEDNFSITLDDQELLRFASIYKGSPSFNFPESYYENWFETEVLVNKLIKKFSLFYGLDLTNDKELIRDLITFMKPTLYEIKSNNPIPDVMVNDETINYPAIHSILLKLLKDFSFTVIKKLSTNRITHLVNYFKASIDRNKNNLRINKNILLVCELGYDNSKLLAQQLTKHYDINIIDTIPFHYIKKYNGLEDIDVIITTFTQAFPTCNKPIVTVSPELTEQDLINLEQQSLPKSLNKIRLSKLINLIQNNSKLNEYIHVSELLKAAMGNTLIDDLSVRKKGLDSMLNLNNIRVNVHATDWEDAIRVACLNMLENHYVTSDYINSVVNVFKSYGVYMIIKDGIAIPHAKNNQDILKTGFSLVILDEPVMTPFDKELNIIFAFSSLDNLEHLEALSEFANLLTNTNFVELAPTFSTGEALLSFIKEQHSKL